MLVLSAISISPVIARQIGAAGACLILISALIFELKRSRSRWLVAVLGSGMVIGLVALAFGLSHLEIINL